MATVGNVVEQKSIGIKLELGGFHSNTELIDGVLQLKPIITNGILTYSDFGEWTSEVIDIGDNFLNYDRVILTQNNEGNSFVSASTRTSEDGITFNSWLELDSENNIISEKNRYIQIKITFTPDVTVENKTINKSEYINEYSTYTDEQDVVLTNEISFRMIEDSTWTEDGSLYRKAITKSEWMMLNKLNVVNKGV